MKQTYEQTISNLIENLTEVKKAKLKEAVFKIIDVWFLEVRENRKKFIEAFFSVKADIYFMKIKEAIGEFKVISKENVLVFISKIVLGKSKDNFYKELHKEFLSRKEDFCYKYYRGDKEGKK